MRFSCRFTSFLREDQAMGLLTAREAAEYLHVSLFTLGRIEKESLLMPFRTPGGHRRYSLEMLNEYLEHTRSRLEAHESRVLVVDDGDEVTDALAQAFPACEFTTAPDELRVGIQLAQFKPDLVLVNTQTRGVEADNLCRRLDGHAEDLKVLAFQASEPAHAGVEATVVISADLDALVQRVALLLDQRAYIGVPQGRGP
jgi:PleD family two-component response regulator